MKEFFKKILKYWDVFFAIFLFLLSIYLWIKFTHWYFEHWK